MPEHDWKKPFRVITGQREGIGVTYAGVGDLDEHLACTRWRHINFDDLKRFTGCECYCSARFHNVSLLGLRYWARHQREPGY
ncbi:hypothetical protein D3C72_2435830 [compost metagenome]